MDKSFLSADIATQLEMLNMARKECGINQFNIEKDFWMCWVLEKLFELENNQFVFKGGTTLSKVYEVIERYSEDIDITVNYTKFIDEIDFSTISGNQLKKKSEELKLMLDKYLDTEVLPYLHTCYESEFGSLPGKFTKVNNETIEFHYSSILEESVYALNYVKLEFGARNTIEPFTIKQINTYLDKINETKSDIRVVVINPGRTFWEKTTLIHVECHRGRLTETPERYARHWYDLYKLSKSSICENAISDKATLNEVLSIKQAFYNNSYSNYDKCITGQFQLVPKANEITALKSDYQVMIDNNYFFREAPSFEEIITGLKELEYKINNFLGH